MEHVITAIKPDLAAPRHWIEPGIRLSSGCGSAKVTLRHKRLRGASGAMSTDVKRRKHARVGMRASTLPGANLCIVALLASPLPVYAQTSSTQGSPTQISPSQTPAQTVATSVPPAQIDAAIARLDEIAIGIQRRSQVPGMAMAVVRDGRVVYAKGFGVRRAGEDVRVDSDTVFQLASLSKSLSATVVAHQVGAGAIQWDTPLVSHLPWFALSDPWVTSHVTLADMFSHRSGLPDHAGDDLEDLGYDRTQILERLGYLPLNSFRNSYAYTNFGLTAAAEAVAVAAGTDWASLADRTLYRPLGMASTSSRFSDFLARTNRASAHVRINGAFVPGPQRQPDAQAPAGGASASVTDLSRWMILILNGGLMDGRPFVPNDALLPAMRAEVISSPSRTADARPSFYGYGIGVSISSTGRVALDHSGAFAMGAGTTYRLVPSLGLGIAVLTNAQPVGAAEAIVAEFMDQVELGQSSRDWYAAYSQAMAPLLAPVGSLAGKSPPPHAAAPAPLHLYAGRYENPYFGAAVVSLAEGDLILALGPDETRRFTLSHWDGNTFAFVPTGENEPAGSRTAVVFAQSGSEAADELSIDFLNTEGMGHFMRR
ncbi:MAG: serine hydrolase [Pseudomonadota bacterium]